jgi:Leucine-rich repeat (LRR) protein
MSKEALRRIAENKKSKEMKLNLNGSGMQGPLPEEVAELTWLETLYLHSTQVTDLQALKGLTKLKELYLWATPSRKTPTTQGTHHN